MERSGDMGTTMIVEVYGVAEEEVVVRAAYEVGEDRGLVVLGDV